MWDEESRTMTDAAKQEMSKIGNRFAKFYSMLADKAFQRGERMWKMSPKLHLFIHLTSLQASIWGSPRYWWTYSDEDLIGILVDVAEGVHINTLATSVLFKWLWLCFDDSDVYE